MATIENYIESQYRELIAYINIEYIELYSSFNNHKLQEIFSTIQHMFADNYSAMNSRLPTGDIGNHFWAENSRDLLLAIDVLKGLERVLKNTENAFEIDPYYRKVIDKSMSFLSKSGGSTIPPNMEKIEIYYTDPILHKSQSIIINTPVESSFSVELQKLRSGSYATVFVYTDQFYNKKFALKRANDDLTDKELIRFKQEYETMKKLFSPYVIEVYRYSELKKEYIMEYMDYSLSEFIINSKEKPTDDERKRIIYQIFRAFNYIHSKGLLHRDISPRNILIKQYDDVKVIKIADFGLVKIPESHLTSVDTKFKGSFNDLALMTEGFANYNILHETYALTKIVAFTMTGSANPTTIVNPNLKAFVEKGISLDKKNRYKSVEEMTSAFRSI